MTTTYFYQIDTSAMPHEAYMRRPGEDWAGITNQRERKKLQNRLNQRARRQRKKQHSCDTTSPNGCMVAFRHDRIILGDGIDDTVDKKRAFLDGFAKQALASYAARQPTTSHLLRLIQLNVIESLTCNSTMLGLKGDWLICSCISPFNLDESSQGPDAPLAYPDNLAPTDLQRKIPHHPWIDLFPLPRMRDNYLNAFYMTKTLSVEEDLKLWNDLIEEQGEKTWTGMIVWGEPWDPRNWEVTVPFLQRWGWLLEGCYGIVESTNYWRRRRGEKWLSTKELSDQWPPRDEMVV